MLTQLLIAAGLVLVAWLILRPGYSLDRLIRATRDDGGGTFECGSLRPYTERLGYVVSLESEASSILAAEADRVAIAQAVDSVEHAHPTAYVGTWIDHGRLYVDACVIVYDRQRALDLGREHGQLAVYDLAARKDIRL